MAEEVKNYLATVGVGGFYYGILDELTNTVDAIHRVEFLQEISVEMPQEVTKAFGDNTTAAMAVSGGDITVTSKFHSVPNEDKQRLFGMEVKDGIMSVGSEDKPPMVALVFFKTLQDKTEEYVGLTKGLFTRPKIEGQTQEEGKIEFGSDEIEGQFMDREVSGYTKKKSVLMGADKDGETTVRDSLFMKVFGLPHPDAVVTP